MQTVVGPVITREGGYAFDSWTPQTGLNRGYPYRRVEDAHYARRVEIRSHPRSSIDHILACNTIDEFAAELAECEFYLETVGIARIRT
jgi:hypothetical protein